MNGPRIDEDTDFPIHRLARAAALIRTYMRRLNLEKKVCEHCGRETFESFGDRQRIGNVIGELTAIASKLDRFAKADGGYLITGEDVEDE